MLRHVDPSPSAKGSLFIYKYKNKRVLASREIDYCAAVRACRALFAVPATATVSFHTKDLDICGGEMMEIAQSSWAEVIGQLESVMVVVKNQRKSSSVAPSLVQPVARPDGTDDPCLRINVESNAHSDLPFIVGLNAPMSKVLRVFAEETGLCEEDYQLYHRGIRLSPDDTPSSAGIEDKDTIDCRRVPRGGKCVIHLWSPVPVEAAVKLSLVPQWGLSAVYPAVHITQRTSHSPEAACWRVKLHSDGSLTELTRCIEVAYLSWDAHSNLSVTPASFPAPESSEAAAAGVEIFYPNDPILNDTNSVVMPVDKIASYLRKSLSALGLHIGARASFIKYWLPSLSKHENVALRFLPQASYEDAAPLEVLPPPEVVTRVFMIFQGVEDEELGLWPLSIARAVEGVKWWRDVVGVDAERATDQSLFRVLEWGGMEVLRSSS